MADESFCRTYSWSFRREVEDGRQVIKGRGFCPKCGGHVETTLEAGESEAMGQCGCGIREPFPRRLMESLAT